MTLIEIVSQELLEPVGIRLAKIVKHRTSLCYEFIDIRSIAVLLSDVFFRIYITGCIWLTETALEFKFLIGIHHLHSPSTSESHTTIEIVCDHSVAVCTAHGSNLQHAVCCLSTIKGTGHSILKNLYFRDIEWIKGHERI